MREKRCSMSITFNLYLIIKNNNLILWQKTSKSQFRACRLLVSTKCAGMGCDIEDISLTVSIGDYDLFSEQK